MAEIVNLRIARKARQRADKEAQAAANRAKFGQSKGTRKAQKLDANRAESRLDGAKRDPE